MPLFVMMWKQQLNMYVCVLGTFFPFCGQIQYVQRHDIAYMHGIKELKTPMKLHLEIFVQV